MSDWHLGGPRAVFYLSICGVIVITVASGGVMVLDSRRSRAAALATSRHVEALQASLHAITPTPTPSPIDSVNQSGLGDAAQVAQEPVVATASSQVDPRPTRASTELASPSAQASPSSDLPPGLVNTARSLPAAVVQKLLNHAHH